VASEVVFTEFVVTRVLRTARISNVESTMCDTKERKMVNFKLGKKWERWNIQFVTSVGQSKKSESSTGIEPMTSRTPVGPHQKMRDECLRLKRDRENSANAKFLPRFR